MNMYSSKVHIKRLTGAFFLVDIQTGSYLSSLWTSSTGRLGDLLHASYGRLAAGKGRHTYIPIKMASGVQDITCVFVEVAESYEKNFNLTVSWDGV